MLWGPKRGGWRLCLVCALFAISVVAVAPAPASASPGALKVLIVFSDSGATPATIKGQIAALPGVAAVDTFNAESATPALAKLTAYDVVMPFSDSSYANPVTLGNNLADYEDAGGVVAAFHYAWGQPGEAIAGRWYSGGYSPYTDSSASIGLAATLGTHDAGSPLLAGVTTLRSSNRDEVRVAQGATELAKWSDGLPAVAVRGRAVGVNAYVGDFRPDCGCSGDFARIVVNAGNVLRPHTVTVAKVGIGAGTVTSSPAGINCGVACSASFDYASIPSVTLTASPAGGSTFAGWSGAGCSGTGACTVSTDTARSVTATFSPAGAPTALGVSPSTFKLTGRKVKGRCVKPTAKNNSKPRCKRPINLHIHYMLTAPATVTFTLKREATGRRVRGKCVKPTKKNQKHKQCSRLVSLHAAVTQTGTSGANTFLFTGKIGGHKLRPGTYRLTATTAGGSRSVKFRIAR